MYQGFLEAHDRAEALAGLTPELRCNRAQGLHLFERKLPEAEAQFRQLTGEKSTSALAYTGLSMLYSTLGRLDDALECVDAGYTVDPLLPILPAAEVSVRFWRQEYELAVAAA
jgi:tetratricopeptide (TPR) repeat protein